MLLSFQVSVRHVLLYNLFAEGLQNLKPLSTYFWYGLTQNYVAHGLTNSVHLNDR